MENKYKNLDIYKYFKDQSYIVQNQIYILIFMMNCFKNIEAKKLLLSRLGLSGVVHY